MASPELRRRPVLLSVDECRVLGDALTGLINRRAVDPLLRSNAVGLRQRLGMIARAFEARRQELERAAEREREQGAALPSAVQPATGRGENDDRK